jgi:hypothetical protein
MKRNSVKKGFAFKPNIKYIEETMDIPAKAKLEWLEDMKNFTYKALSKKKLQIWEKIKRGEA